MERRKRMPHINRIRVNNVKYNFGTQIYDDFVMRFSCKNTIYDLANGGGKSVLMLLLLQNLIPNSTLDEKQPIEKLFRSGNDNTVIHSLIEWKLDNCYVKNGYKYMTTGFCARKGRESADESEENTKNVETATIEYFNYVIFYREFNDNDMRNLPLNNGTEKITYSGLKNYLKELERKNFSLEVKIFEKKGEYQNFISRYGLYESEWEIIRGINKTEGHVRTYFETNYRTTRKVVEDLLIEEIIEKSYNNKINSGEDNVSDIAQVLIDIKDKLMELSKKKDEIDRYDMQIALIDEFADEFADLRNVYVRKADLEEKITSYFIAAKQNLLKKEEEKEQILKTISELNYKTDEEEKNIMRAKVKEEIVAGEEIDRLVADTQSDIDNMSQEKSEYEKNISIREAANEYSDYIKYQDKSREIKTLIDNQKKDNKEITDELRLLALVKHDENEQILKTLKDDLMQKQKADGENRTRYEKYKEEEKNCDRTIAVMEGDVKRLKNECEVLEKKVSALRAGTDVLVLDNIDANIAACENEIKRLTDMESDYELNKNGIITDIDEYNSKISAIEVKKEYLAKEIIAKKEVIAKSESNRKKIDNLMSVYDVTEEDRLITKIDDTYINVVMELNSLLEKVTEYNEYVQSLNNGDIPKICEELNHVKEYMIRIFGDKVVTGSEYLEEYDAMKRKKLLQEKPYIPFSLIIKEDFCDIMSAVDNRIMGDKLDFIAFIDKNSLEDGDELIDGNKISLMVRNGGILYDEELKEDEIKNTVKKIADTEEKITVLSQKSAIIKEDYNFISRYYNSYKDIVVEKKLLTELEKELLNVKEDEKVAKDNADACKKELDTVNKNIKKNILQLKTAREYAELLAEIKKNYNILNAKYNELNDLKDAVNESKKNYDRLHREISRFEDSMVDYNEQIYDIKAKIDDINNTFKEIFAEYYDEDIRKNIKEADILKRISNEDTEARFRGLKAVIDRENADLGDKIALMNNYNEQADKIIKNLEYRNVNIEELKELSKNNRLIITPNEELLKIRDKISKVNKEINAKEKILDAQSADRNRLLGSIAHAIKSIEEKYGMYEELKDVDNLTRYIEERNRLKNSLNSKISIENKNVKECDALCMKYRVMEKDLERYIEDAEINITQSMLERSIDMPQLDYEEVQKSYQAVKKEQNKLMDNLTKSRLKLTESLEKLGAYELSDEIKRSVDIPYKLDGIDELTHNLHETTSLIALEKERIGKSIKDMEQIKQNFENQCIQTCTLIKGELDKLSKLSRINMEDEIISIINLQIPYIKDEFYEQRMGEYIDDTIANAENFTTAQDRVKYIRTRLSWKKLFSAIVTDMNAIRLNLYKRERIKSQSRYLKYEEAVGSTGQSQGIYIQFLIAIINYITSINATGREQGVLTKVIFIDNPFGAAKDVYIWEPIFKLLKTNNVQLIVPARGATPAITGRFDVNYVLGQKLVDKRQQTVVVDYRSQVNNDDMEYERLSYTQSSFVF